MPNRLMHTSTEEFDAIRPYYDAEVREVVQRLATDAELISVILRFKFPRLVQGFFSKSFLGQRFIIRPLKWLIQRELSKHLTNISSVREFQLHIADYMRQMLATTTQGFSVSGLDKLAPEHNYLFISNHRDIAMDPALVNYALYLNGRDTVRIAIGDNLLQKSYANDLMRLNKSFIVPRSAKGVRQVLAAFNLLSRYIHHSLKEEHQSIWIAQKEGRAKDGIDFTDPAIIKMLYMADKKAGLSFNESIASLRLVPVALSYEYDPLDNEKAHELAQLAQNGHYAKAEFEDLFSIARGIAGFKGRVHVAFGTPLSGDFADADAVAAAVDQQIRSLYRLYPSNYLALAAQDAKLGLQAPEPLDAASVKFFNQRLAKCPAAYRQHWLSIYANPVKNRHGLL